MDVESEENRESVEQILRAGRHLLALINEVLDIARIEAGQMSLSVEPVSVGSVLRESVDLVRPTAARNGIVLRAPDVLRSEQFVRADQQRLKQVLLNLLSNAIKYNRPGGTVEITCEPRGDDRLRLVVRDTGAGLAVGKLERLFTPFDRLGADQSGVEGTGLGLALSRGLMQAMGGSIGVESVEGEGSRFWVDLPLTSPPEAADLPEQPEPEPRAAATSVEHTVLFIEDNLANVRLMERVFRRRPEVRLLSAMQGRLGLDLAREHRPDLILLDRNLPDLRGEDVMLQMRKDPKLRDIPVVMISGDAIPSQVQRMLDAGARAYITKPFDVPELLRTVDGILASARP
jgi:CheY-like chemotaxis protein